MSFYEMTHHNSHENIYIDSFSTTTHKYEINVHKESNEYYNIPHFHVMCTEGEIVSDNILLIPRPTDLIEEGIDNNINLMPFHKNMDKEIVLCIDRNIYLSHFTTRYFAGKHPIIVSDFEFLDALNECLRKEINPNGQTNWDYICMVYHNYLHNNSDGWNKFSKEVPNYISNMILIQQ